MLSDTSACAPCGTCESTSPDTLIVRGLRIDEIGEIAFAAAVDGLAVWAVVSAAIGLLAVPRRDVM